MVLSMSNTNQPHLPQRITVTMKFNFNSIFYVRYKSEEISPLEKVAHDKNLEQNATFFYKIQTQYFFRT